MGHTGSPAARATTTVAALAALLVLLASCAGGPSPADAARRTLAAGTSYRYTVDSPRTGALSAAGSWSARSATQTVTVRDAAGRAALGALGSSFEIRTVGRSTWFHPGAGSPVATQLGATGWLAQTDGDVAAVAVDVAAVLQALSRTGGRAAAAQGPLCGGAAVPPGPLVAALRPGAEVRGAAAEVCLDGGRLAAVHVTGTSKDGPVSFHLTAAGPSAPAHAPPAAEVFAAPTPR